MTRKNAAAICRGAASSTTYPPTSASPSQAPRPCHSYSQRAPKRLPHWVGATAPVQRRRTTPTGWLPRSRHTRTPAATATVNRVLDLWRHGEKTLVFCFYVETGRALRSHISRALRTEIITHAASALGMSSDSDNDVLAELDRIGERLLRSDARGYQAFRDRVRSHATRLDSDTADQVAEIAVRFMRTPSFLVRFVGLKPNISVEDLVAGLEHADVSGATLADRIEAFARSLAQKVQSEK